jgi:hypothetical protein
MRIHEKDLKSQELSQLSIDLSKKIYSYRQTILSYLTNIYSEGNMVLDTDGEVDIVKGLILSDSDTDTILSDMTYKSLITILGQKFVDEYRSLKKESYVLRIHIEEERTEMRKLQDTMELQKSLLESQRGERVRLVEVTK